MHLPKPKIFTYPIHPEHRKQLKDIAFVYDDNMKFFKYDFNSSGERGILIVSDKIVPGDKEYFLEGKEREVVEKLLIFCLNQIKENDLKDLGYIAFLPFEAGRPEISDRKNTEDRRRLAECNQIFLNRLMYFINAKKPSCVICCGLDPFYAMYNRFISNNPKHIVKHRFNRLFKAEYKDVKFDLMGCIDLVRPCAWDTKHRDLANLLGYLTDGWIQAIQGFNFSNIELKGYKCIYINTIEKFNSFYKNLLKEDIVAIDTEGSGLGRLTSKLYSVQFAFTRDKGYFLPLDHPDTPFSSKELYYIKKKLKYYFEFKRCRRYHIYQYGKYDVGQFYAQLGIRYYNHRIYDTMGGAYCFDPETYINTEKGKIKIKELTNMQNPPRVLSFNHKTEKLEYKNIEYSSSHISNKRMICINYGCGSINVTEDHEIWSVTRNKYVKALDIFPDEEILVLEQ